MKYISQQPKNYERVFGCVRKVIQKKGETDKKRQRHAVLLIGAKIAFMLQFRVL